MADAHELEVFPRIFMAPPGMKIEVATNTETYRNEQLRLKRQRIGIEDREYHRYGRRIARRLVALGRGHRYRIRKYRRKNSEMGWFLTRGDVQAWLERWHVQADWVVGLTNTTQLRDGNVRETATIISCAEIFSNGQSKEWQVAVPEKWPRQGARIPRRLA